MKTSSHDADDSEDDLQRADRRLQRLCGQVARLLNLAFGGTCNDDFLADLIVDSVEPDPDATRLKVTVCLMERSEHIDPELVLRHLEHAKSFLRSEIAAAIDRRKTPQLSFRLKRPGTLPGESPFR